MSTRTLVDFVEDMLSNGRSFLEINAIARCCRWEHSIEEIRKILEKFDSNSSSDSDNIVE